MPLTAKGKKILDSMKKQYGEEAGERVFYASQNKGTISEVERASQSKRMNDRIRGKR